MKHHIDILAFDPRTGRNAGYFTTNLATLIEKRELEGNGEEKKED
jgi:hypothetical protein